MSDKNTEEKLSPLSLIEKEVKEKTAQLKEITEKVQGAKNFVQQNEPNIYALNGALQQLSIIKQELEKPDKMQNTSSTR